MKTSSGRRILSSSHWGAFYAVIENDRLMRCDPFEHDPFPSRILESMPKMIYSSLRIKRPAVRKGWLKNREHSDRAARGSEEFVEISWKTALELVADELCRVRTDKGDSAIFGGSYGWSSAGRFHHARSQTHRFLHAGGGCTNQTGNFSWGAAKILLPYIIGTYEPVTGRNTSVNSIRESTQCFLAFGGLPTRNMQITSGGSGSHTSASWIESMARTKCRFIIVSPSRSDVPKGVDAQWISIRPNTDTALMLSLMHTLYINKTYNQEFLEQYCVGFPELLNYLKGQSDGTVKSAEWASPICGIDVSAIKALAQQISDNRTLINCTWSLQRAHHGEQSYWSTIALAAMLGEIGLPGGGFAFGFGSSNGIGIPRLELASPAMPAIQNPLKTSVPVARTTDMLLNPRKPYHFNGKTYKYPDIDLIYWAGGNPFHHNQDLNRFEKAWQKPSTVIVQESWWTATARRADIVLPVTTTLERNDIGGSSRDCFVIAMHKAIPNYFESWNDFDIYKELASLGGYEELFTEGRDEAAWLRYIYADMQAKWRVAGISMKEFDEFWSTGWVKAPELHDSYILFEAFRNDPLSAPLKTESGRIELFSNALQRQGHKDLLPHPAWLPPSEWLGAEAAKRFPLHLISSQPADKLHSQLDPGDLSLSHKRNGRQQVSINPQDAANRRIVEGADVHIFNDRGDCLAVAKLDSNVLNGVIILPTGAWFDGGIQEIERHGNPNVLTSGIASSELTQGSSAMSALVEIQLAEEGIVKPIRVFSPPALCALGDK